MFLLVWLGSDAWITHASCTILRYPIFSCCCNYSTNSVSFRMFSLCKRSFVNYFLGYVFDFLPTLLAPLAFACPWRFLLSLYFCQHFCKALVSGQSKSIKKLSEIFFSLMDVKKNKGLYFSAFLPAQVQSFDQFSFTL